MTEAEKILVIDDHQLILGGTTELLQKRYPQAKIQTAETAQQALIKISEFSPNVVIIDLSIPEQVGERGQVEIGIKTLRTLLQDYSHINLVVLSGSVETLVRLKHEIEAHEGGFTVAAKTLANEEMLARVDWALQGLTHTKDVKEMRTGEIKPEWLDLLNLAAQGFTDKEMGKRLNIAERTVRHHWTKIQDVLAVYPEEGRNLRISTLIRAREEGLID